MADPAWFVTQEYALRYSGDDGCFSRHLYAAPNYLLDEATGSVEDPTLVECCPRDVTLSKYNMCW